MAIIVGNVAVVIGSRTAKLLQGGSNRNSYTAKKILWHMGMTEQQGEKLIALIQYGNASADWFYLVVTVAIGLMFAWVIGGVAIRAGEE